MPSINKDEIQRRLKRGEPDGEIREELKRKGFSEKEIQAAFPAHQYDLRSWLLYFACIVTIAGIIILLNNGGYLLLLLGA